MAKKESNYTMSFSKIKINDKKTVINYIKHVVLPNEIEDQRGVRNVIIPMESEVKPSRDFVMAFQKLKEYAIPYLELSIFNKKIEQEILDKHIVTGLSIMEDTDTVKIIISMTRYLKNKKAHNINTPLIDLENDDFTEIEDLRECFWTVIDEAKKYLKGKNGEEQLKLQFEAA